MFTFQSDIEWKSGLFYVMFADFYVILDDSYMVSGFFYVLIEDPIEICVSKAEK